MGKYLCSTKENSKYWLNNSCCGVFTCVVIHFIFLSSNLLLLTTVVPTVVSATWKRVLILAELEVFCFMAEWAHVMCVFTDPGSVPSDAAPLSSATEEERMHMCAKCGHFKPPRAHHCSECGRCIVKMDHHCPWINNCVGIGTMKFFVLFLVYTFFYCLQAIVFFGYFFGYQLSIDSEESWKYFCSAIFALLALFFTIFTLSMFCDITSVIRSGTTSIDVLKGVSYSSTLEASLAEVFGGKGSFSALWLLPVKPVYIDRDDIFGYRRESLESVVVTDRSGDWVS